MTHSVLATLSLCLPRRPWRMCWDNTRLSWSAACVRHWIVASSAHWLLLALPHLVAQQLLPVGQAQAPQQQQQQGLVVPVALLGLRLGHPASGRCEHAAGLLLHSCCCIPPAAFLLLLHSSCCIPPAAAFLLLHSFCCIPPAAAFLLLHSSCCCIPSAAFLLLHSFCFPSSALLGYCLCEFICHCHVHCLLVVHPCVIMYHTTTDSVVIH
jgi:hypothetical protein